MDGLNSHIHKTGENLPRLIEVQFGAKVLEDQPLRMGAVLIIMLMSFWSTA